MANVWLKSRALRRDTYERSIPVEPDGKGYADILRYGRRFRFSHEATIREKNGTGTIWLVYEDAGVQHPAVPLREPRDHL